MDEKRPNEINAGYEIKESIIFDNNRGFAFAKSINTEMFVTWQFAESENGKRDYGWGHYTPNGETARRDYADRIFDYQRQYNVAEKGNYKYYSTQRPVDIGTFPKTGGDPVRIVNFDERENVESGSFKAWGYLEYSAPLTYKQMDDYELKPSRFNPDIREAMREQAQTVGTWEEKRATPDNLRLTFWDTDGELFLPKYHVTPAQLSERFSFAMAAHTRAAKKPRPIAEQFAEGAAQAAKDNADRPPSGEKSSRKNEDRT